MVAGSLNKLSTRQTVPAEEIVTPLHFYHIVTGAHCMVSTNSSAILATARSFFRLEAEPTEHPDLTLRFWVDPTSHNGRPWPQPYFRSVGRWHYASFGAEDALILDLHRAIALGRFSPSMAADRGNWQRLILPALVGLASEALGVTVVHCACVERDGCGLLLAGESGAGKSTLSLAMTRRGFAFLSDDWTYLSLAGGQPTAWGLATHLKLLPDSVQYFPELRNLTPTVALNGERAFEIDPENVFDVERRLRCEPHWLVFLERRNQPGHAFVRMPPEEAARRLESAQEPLPPECSTTQQAQSAIIQSLVNRECWLLRHGERPAAIAQVLEQCCNDGHRPARIHSTTLNQPHDWRKGPDLTKRLIATPLVADLTAARCAVRLETNSATIFRLIVDSLNRGQSGQTNGQTCLWRLVSDEAMLGLEPHGLSSSISAEGIELVTIGRHGFIAMDAATRCAVGFLSEQLIKDEYVFQRSVLRRLVSFTEASVAL